MNDSVLFGAAYYPEYMPYDRIDKDFSMMKKAGMNVVRVQESTWSTLEPSDGVFDYTYIDRILDKAQEYNINVIVGTPTYAIPSWLAREYPEVMVTTSEGVKKYGSRQIMDITDPVFLKYAERVIRRLISHVADSSVVIGYQIDNETKYYGNSTIEMKKRFAEHLRKKFVTTKAFNEAYGLAYWSNSISDWKDLPDPDGTVNAGIAGEYERFRRSAAAEYLKWQAGIVSEYKKPDQFITHNFDFDWSKGYSYGIQPNMDQMKAAESVTIAGCDIYHPSQDNLTGAEIAFGGDATRNLKAGKNYITMETESQAFKGWTPYPGQLRLQAYSHLASGARGIMYWNWHSIHNSVETYWKGVLSHDLEENPIYDEACIIGKEWAQAGLDGLVVTKRTRTAIVVDNQSLTAMKYFPADAGLSYNDIVRWTYDCLYEMNIECDIVNVNALNIDDYDMIITPALYSVTNETVNKLKKFTSAGGVLVSTFRSFVADDNFSVYHDRAPHGLTDVFGMHYQEMVDPATSDMHIHDKESEETKAYYLAELLMPSDDTDCIHYKHKYWGNYSAVTANSYGKGRAYYIGTFTDKDFLKKVFGKARKDVALIKGDSSIQEAEKFSFPLIVRSGATADGHNVHYIFNYSSDEILIDNPYEDVTDILTGHRYLLSDSMCVSDWGVMVLRDEKKIQL